MGRLKKIIEDPLSVLPRPQAEAGVRQLYDLYFRRGSIKPADVVEVSRPDDAPMHDVFEWNDQVAAERFREDQARHVIRSVRIVMVSDGIVEPTPTRVLTAVQPADDSTATDYVPSVQLRSKHVSLREQRNVLLDELVELEARYTDYPALLDVLRAAQERLISLKVPDDTPPESGGQGGPLVPNNNNPPVRHLAQPMPTRDLLQYFDALHQELLGERAFIRVGKDAKLIASLCHSHGPNRVRELMDLFFSTEDDFVLQAGYTVGVFVSQCSKLVARQRLGGPVGKTVTEKNLNGLRNDLAVLDEFNRRGSAESGTHEIGRGDQGADTDERRGPRGVVSGLPRRVV